MGGFSIWHMMILRRSRLWSLAAEASCHKWWVMPAKG